MAEEKLEVVRKLRYKKPDNTFEEYPIGTDAEFIKVGDQNLVEVIEDLNNKSLFIIKLSDNINRFPILIELSKEKFPSINFDLINSAYLEDPTPLSFATTKSVEKTDNSINIEIHNPLSIPNYYYAGTKLLLYLTCDEDL